MTLIKQPHRELDAVPPLVRSGLDLLAVSTSRLAGEHLIGLTVFGAVLTPEFEPARSPAATVMVLDGIELGLLRRLAEQGPGLASRGVDVPLVMTPAYIQESLDSFPLEFLEISQRRLTLAGRDCFEHLVIQQEHLRLQCEREFKRIMIRLRQALLTAGTREEMLGDIGADIGLHLVRTLRGMLWLKGRREFQPREQLMTDVERSLGDSYSGIRRAILSPGGLGWPEFQAFYADVNKLAERSNAL